MHAFILHFLNAGASTSTQASPPCPRSSAPKMKRREDWRARQITLPPLLILSPPTVGNPRQQKVSNPLHSRPQLACPAEEVTSYPSLFTIRAVCDSLIEWDLTVEFFVLCVHVKNCRYVLLEYVQQSGGGVARAQIVTCSLNLINFWT